MTDNDFAIPGYIDLSIDDVRTVAHGGDLPDPAWLFPEIENGIGPTEFAASVEGLRRRGLVRRGADGFEIDSSLMHAVELAATPGPAVVVMSGSTCIGVSWLFVGSGTTAVFTREPPSDQFTLRQITNEAIVRAILRLTRTPLTDHNSHSTSLQVSDTDAREVRRIVDLIFSPGTAAQDLAPRINALDLTPLAAKFSGDSTVNSVLMLRPAEGLVQFTHLLWLTSAEHELQLIEPRDVSAIAFVPVTTQQLFSKLSEAIASMTAPLASGAG